ncbi:MAG: hydroxyacid dehydrogenase [Deltaproteobacteria bacterium]|nr:hydroxyacid dehydrogenase [Deltaproteobacteria bacterium]
MKIAIFEVEEWERGAFMALEAAHEIVFSHDPIGAGNADEFSGAEVISTFIYSDLGADVLARLKGLKLIATRSTGFDHIDTGYCARKGVLVSNVPAYGDNTVAEHVFGLMLMISHNLYESVERTRKGDFSIKGLRGFDLLGKTLGVLGTGRIGRCVIEIARGFRMDVLAYDIHPDNALAERLGFRYAPVEEVLSSSDIITVHLPATASTRDLISKKEFSMMKEGAVIINTARGGIIDVQALLEAVTKGRVRAAGLDVLPEEPSIREEAELIRSIAMKKPLEALLADHVLLKHRNVYITPHNAFNTKEAVGRILDTTVDNIASYIRGAPKNIVAGYEFASTKG